MSATYWGMVLTTLTGFAAGAAATAFDERHMLIAVVATLAFQSLAIVSFLHGARRHREKQRISNKDDHENRLTAVSPDDTMIAPHTDNNQTGIEM